MSHCSGIKMRNFGQLTATRGVYGYCRFAHTPVNGPIPMSIESIITGLSRLFKKKGMNLEGEHVGGIWGKLEVGSGLCTCTYDHMIYTCMKLSKNKHIKLK